MNQNRPNLKFPAVLLNDLEGYLHYFPKKFPLIVNEYEELVRKFWNNPEELDNHCRFLIRELWKGWEKIKNDFYKIKKENKTAEFLLNLDQKLQKLNCFRFWIINYALCEGPLHDYYVNIIRSFSSILGRDEDREDELRKKEYIERLLLKSDYKDLYLRNALAGFGIYKALESIEETKVLFKKIKDLVDRGKVENSYEPIDKIVEIISDDLKNPNFKGLVKNLGIPISASKVKGDNSVVYVTVISAIEFYKSNLDLEKEYENIRKKIKSIFEKAKEVLNGEDYEELILAYNMLIKFKKFKDDFGAIDPHWLPFWLNELLSELEEKIGAPKGSCAFGPGSCFYAFPWYLPPDLIKMVFTIDKTSFNLGEV